MTKKIDPLQTLHGEQGTQTRNAAIVYLHEERAYNIQTLATLTELAVSTIKSYLSKFRHLLEWGKKHFLKLRKVAETASQYWCYIDKITMKDGSTLCKIGKTTCGVEARAKQIKTQGWSKNKVKTTPAKVEVQKVFKCKNATAMQNMEDMLRAGMTALAPDKYIPNDRLNAWEDDFPDKIMQNKFVQLGLLEYVA